MMKLNKSRITAFILALAILFVPFGGMTSFADEAPESGEVITLTPDDFTVTRTNNCNVSGNEVTSVANTYPQFKITLPEVYYLEQITFKITVNGIAYRCGANAGVAVAGQRYQGTLPADKQSEITLKMQGEGIYTPVETISFTGFWVKKPTAGESSLTIDSIDIIGTKLTDTVEFSGDSVSLKPIANCTIDGDTITAPINQYPQFYLELGKNYYVKDISITATAENYSYTTGSNSIFLNKGKEKVAEIPWYYSSYSNGVTSTKSNTLADEYQILESDRVAFYGFFTTKPTEDLPGKLTVNSVVIKYWIVPKDNVMIDGTEVILSAINHANVEDNVIKAASRSPQFRIALTQPSYASSVDMTFVSSYTSNLGWSNKSLTLGFDDGTTAAVKVSVGAGEQPYYYWLGTIKAGDITTVNVVIPDEYQGKKLSHIRAAGYFVTSMAQEDYDNGDITLLDVTVNDAPNEFATDIIDRFTNPMTALDAKDDYNNLNFYYKSVIDPHIEGYDYAPVIVSVQKDSDISYGLKGNTNLNLRLSAVNYADYGTEYYISEFGVLIIPTELLGENELTLDTEGAMKIYRECEDIDDLSAYTEFTLPIVIGTEYANTDVTVRTYAKYEDGYVQAVHYSSGTDDEIGTQNGTVAVTLASRATISESLGDANADTAVNIRDIVRIARYIADNSVEISFTDADINIDDVIDGKDISALAEHLIGNTEFPEPTDFAELLDESLWLTQK